MKRVAILGLGLIGGSLGMALRNSGADVFVHGFDKRRQQGSWRWNEELRTFALLPLLRRWRRLTLSFWRHQYCKWRL